MMEQEVTLIRARLKAPRAGAIAGIVFSTLFIISLVLIRLSVPADPQDAGTWLSGGGKTVSLALNLLPFAGIAFLWFVGVVRDRIGAYEDRFFATVFLGSGLLFLAASCLNFPPPSTGVARSGKKLGIVGNPPRPMVFVDGNVTIKGNEKVIIGAIGDITSTYPITFAFGLFFASVLLFSQAATTRALMPLGISLGIPSPSLISMWPAVNGYFFLPTYGTLIAAINFDRSGTTRIGRFVLNHSFMFPGLVATAVSIGTGLVISRIFF